MSNEEIFGKILQEERKAKKISQEKLAKLTGLDRTFISLIENGKRSPTFSTILKFVPLLRFIHPNYLPNSKVKILIFSLKDDAQ